MVLVWHVAHPCGACDHRFESRIVRFVFFWGGGGGKRRFPTPRFDPSFWGFVRSTERRGVNGFGFCFPPQTEIRPALAVSASLETEHDSKPIGPTSSGSGRVEGFRFPPT